MEGWNSLKRRCMSSLFSPGNAPHCTDRGGTEEHIRLSHWLFVAFCSPAISSYRRSPVTAVGIIPVPPSYAASNASQIMALHHRQLGRLLPRLLLEAMADDDGDAAPSPFNSPRASYSVAPFQPGIAVIVGVLTIIFSLTFILLLYARHCKRSAASYGTGRGGLTSGAYPSSAERRHSGVERAVVESLPVFRFEALRGQKEGLECAVCLSRFEPSEALRLLPKCGHGFHVECVDTWLDAHSTCPLCRVRVDPEDILLVPRPVAQEAELGGSGEKVEIKTSGDGSATTTPNPFGRRISGRHSSAGERSSEPLQTVHRNEAAAPKWKQSVDCRGSATSEPSPASRIRKDTILLTETVDDREAFERRLSHRIVVSNFDGRLDRWSDLRPTDLLFLRREMIVTDSGRFSASKVDRARSGSPAPAAAIASKSASETAGVRWMPNGLETVSAVGVGGARRIAEEERTMRRWLGFASIRTAARWPGVRGRSNGPES